MFRVSETGGGTMTASATVRQEGLRRSGTSEANGQGSESACGAQEKVRAKMRAVDELLGTHGLHCMSAENQVGPALCGAVLVWYCEMLGGTFTALGASVAVPEQQGKPTLGCRAGCVYHRTAKEYCPAVGRPCVPADFGLFHPPSRVREQRSSEGEIEFKNRTSGMLASFAPRQRQIVGARSARKRRAHAEHVFSRHAAAPHAAGGSALRRTPREGR